MPSRLRPALMERAGRRGDGLALRPLDTLGGLARASDLEPLAARLFGRPERPPGWLRRKMGREVVRPELSWVLCDAAAPEDARGWRGYFLVGAPPSCHPAARGCGLGVAPELRGAGLGTRLLNRALQGLAARGLQALHVLAEPERVGFYRRQGFVELDPWTTFAADGIASASAPAPGHAPGPWSRPGFPFVHGAFLPEAWGGTPAEERRTWEGRATFAHLSREAGGWLVHRLCARSPELDPADLRALLAAIPRSRRCYLAGIDPRPARRRALMAAGFRLVQGAREMRRVVPRGAAGSAPQPSSDLAP